MIGKFQRIWFAPIDASFLAVFRVMFGALLLFESVNYGIFLCLDCMYRSSSMLFKFQYFEWVGLWPSVGLELHFLVMALSALCVMLGLYYRFAMVLYTLCFCYLFLLDQALYLNHFYLVIIFCCIMSFLPADRYWSLDARRNPAFASNTVPAWSRLWLVVQLEIVLIYAGLVKLNMDWLNLEPMRLWMNNLSADAHPIFQWFTQDTGIAAASYGAVLLHLIGAPLLLWRKARLWVFFAYCVFHTINAFVFNIGIFPFLTIAATLIIFDPDWPKQFYRWVQTTRLSNLGRSSVQQHIVESSVPTSSTVHRQSASTVSLPVSAMSPKTTLGKLLTVLFITVWLVAQVLIPLRHWSIPGDVAWNEAGHRFSWRMMLRSKDGSAAFYVVRNDDDAIKVDQTAHLNNKQIHKMSCNPDLIWQYAQFLDQQYSTGRDDEVKVFVDANCSLNTREAAPLIKRLVDLSAIPRTEPRENWVLPNNKSLPKKFLPI